MMFVGLEEDGRIVGIKVSLGDRNGTEGTPTNVHIRSELGQTNN